MFHLVCETIFSLGSPLTSRAATSQSPLLVHLHVLDAGSVNMAHGPAAHFWNQVLLNIATLIHSYVVYGCFCATKAKLSHCNKEYLAHKVRNIPYLAL